jgi:hypothetical protein
MPRPSHTQALHSSLNDNPQDDLTNLNRMMQTQADCYQMIKT